MTATLHICTIIREIFILHALPLFIIPICGVCSIWWKQHTPCTSLFIVPIVECIAYGGSHTHTHHALHSSSYLFVECVAYGGSNTHHALHSSSYLFVGCIAYGGSHTHIHTHAMHFTLHCTYSWMDSNHRNCKY